MEGTKGIRVKLRNNNQSLIRVESVMSPAGGGAGGGLDNPIASTYHLFNPLYNTAHILQYIFVGKPDYGKSSAFKRAGLLLIFFPSFIV